MPDTPDNIIPITSDARHVAEKFSAEHNRELLTILFTDLVDSTQLQSDLGNMEAARLTQVHRGIVRAELAKYDAREIEWAGDSCLAVFTKPSDAVVFALRMQAEHRRVRKTEKKLPTVRVGMHLGEIVVKKGPKKEDLFGLQISEAARVMSVAEGNQIYCTRTVFDNARSSLTGQTLEGVGKVYWVRHGMYVFKGTADPVELCEVGSSDVGVSSPPKTNEKVTIAPVPAGNTQKFMVVAIMGLLIVGAVFAYQALHRNNEKQVVKTAEKVEQEAEHAKIIQRYLLGLDVAALPADRGATRVAISPDGLQLAYITNDDNGVRHLAVRRLDDFEGNIIPGTQGAVSPFYSPDGNHIAFQANDDRMLRRVSLADGVVTDICSIGYVAEGDWGEDGYIVFGSTFHSGLQRVKATGGEPESITTLKDTPGAELHAIPHILPNGAGYLFSTFTSFATDAKMGLYALSSNGVVHSLNINAVDAYYLPTGHIVYIRDHTAGLLVRHFDIETMAVGDEEFVISEKRIGEGKYISFDLSRSGALVYIAADKRGRVGTVSLRTLVWVDMQGNETPLEEIQSKSYNHARISPDGNQVVLTDEQDVLVYDFQRKNLMPLAYGSEVEFTPIWSPDGREITYAAAIGTIVTAIYMTNADGTGTMEMIQNSHQNQFPQSWSPDGSRLVFAELNRDTGFDMGVGHFGADEDHYSEMVQQTNAAEGASTISKDGKWIAYGVREGSATNIYVSSFPDFDGKWLVSENGGFGAVWAPDGSALYYREGTKMMQVSVEPGSVFRPGNVVELWDEPYFMNPVGGTVYDIHPDGNRFLMIKELEVSTEAKADEDVIVVQNWLEVVKEKAP